MIVSLSSPLNKFEKANTQIIDDQDNFNAIVSSWIPCGAIIGAFFCGSILKFGRRRLILLIDLVIIAGAILTALFNFYSLCFGRFLIGWGMGSIAVVAPTFVNEISPVEFTGVTGASLQIFYSLGFLIAYSVSFFLPYNKLEDGKDNPALYDTKAWRFIFLIPGYVAAIQFFLLLCWFRYDSAKFYEQNNNYYYADLSRRKVVYYEENGEVQLEPIMSSKGTFVISPNAKVTFRELFGPKYRWAIFIACINWAFNQLWGIDVIAFYSNELFINGKEGKDAQRSARIGTFFIGVVAFVTPFLSSYLLTKYGRKTLFSAGYAGMAACFGALIICQMLEWPLGDKIFMVTHVFFYNISTGTVMALYNAEIIPDKGMSVAQTWNWSLTITISLSVVQVFRRIKPIGVYSIFFALNLIGLMYKSFILKETKGLSKEELAELYATHTYDSMSEKDLNYHQIINESINGDEDDKTGKCM